MIHKGNSK